MTTTLKGITPISIEAEVKKSYLDYAMSVIVGRALPDVRDGMKPVHRRVLYAMSELNNVWNKPHKKSARIVGDVIGKYHPHGDTAVYDTIVRMAQPFSMRYMLVDGQGNFGSVDGDAPAAMRYTEIRMDRFAHALLADLEKDTVDFAPNYDGTETAPTVLPTRIPSLLVNGSSGIAVGMATNIPPHNLNEIISATLALTENPAMSIVDLMQHVPGPDFPTAALINGRAGIAQAYATGRGRVVMRARHTVETDDRGKASIIIHELPYQVNKARLMERIGELVRDKRIEGITALRDESDKQGMRMVIEVRKGDLPEIVFNNLLKQTPMQSTFGMNMLALDHGQPRLFNLKQMIEAFIAHRRDVVTRRCLFELAKSRARAHILEGLSVALANIDAMIQLIKAAKNPAEARTALLAQVWSGEAVMPLLGAAGAEATRPEDLLPDYGMQAEGYLLSPLQAQAILELRLHRLTGLEKDKLHDEFRALVTFIAELLTILSDPDALNKVIQDELSEVKKQFGDARRTEIVDVEDELSHEDLIEPEDVVVTLSLEGYVKTQALDEYRAQHRGGRGKASASLKEADVMTQLLTANTHDTILCFSSIGKVYWLKVYRIPKASRGSRGRPLVNLLPLQEGESITEILPIKAYEEDRCIFMSTRLGRVKKVPLTDFSRQRSNGIIALHLNDDDALVRAMLTDGKQSILLMADSGKAIRFDEASVRPMGRSAAGVRGMHLKPGQYVIAAMVAEAGKSLLTATQHGYGQRTDLSDYRVIGRGGQGVRAIQTTERNGLVIGAALVKEDEEVLLISDKGTLVRTPVREISVIGRNTQGVRLIQLSQGESLVAMAPVAGSEPEAPSVEGDPDAL
jgi:DNA gyrase subunit A